jgi:hypothetical protein
MYSESMDEGIRFVHPRMPVIKRPQKIDLLMSALEEDRVVLVRSTPGTGKTSTLQLLEDRLEATKVPHGTLNMLGAGLVHVDASNENGNSPQFDQYCANTLGDDWKTLFDKTERYVLLIDETQAIYQHHAIDFWRKVKSRASMENTRAGLELCIFATYGEAPRPGVTNTFTTPFTPSRVFGSDLLFCSLDETQELVREFNIRVGKGTFITEYAAEAIHLFTGGHVGFIRKALEALFEYSRDRTSFNEVNIFQYLLSAGMVRALCDTRSAPDFSDLPFKCKDLLKRIINTSGGKYEVAVTSDELETVHTLMKRNMIRWCNNASSEVAFVCPAIEHMAISNIYSSAMRPIDEPDNLDEFLLKCIPAFRSDFMRENLGRDDNTALLEPAWQAELFHNATSILTPTSYIHPSVGRMFGSTGMVDFSVNGTKKWLIEITREGDRLPQHADKGTGLYACIPWTARVILDFRAVRPQKKTVDKYGRLVWFVVYESSYKSATIVRKDVPDVQVQFRLPNEGEAALAGLLTKMTPSEALQSLFAKLSVDDKKALLDKLGT